MQRDWLLSKLEAYCPKNSNELDTKNSIISFVRGNENCFASNHPPTKGEESLEQMGHITGSCWLLDRSHKKTLLTHHRKLQKWLQLGGHSDGHPNVLQTAIREAKEESGINKIIALSEDVFDIDIHQIPAKGDRSAHLHYDVRFILAVDSGEDFQVSHESLDLRWFSAEEILNSENMEDSLKRMTHKWLSFIEVYH